MYIKRRNTKIIRKYYHKAIGGLLFTALIFLIWFILIVNACDLNNKNFIKCRATVYSLKGKTAMGTPVRWGVCASGNKNLLGKSIIIYQRLPDDSIGDAIGVYSIEDTGCGSEVIDIWCPEEYQKAIINKTWEKGCNGKIYVQIVDVEEK